MTVIRPNSISGITSITAQANEINVFKSDGTLAGLSLNGVNVNTTTGISTYAALNVTGNVSVGGTLTYQDVTNVDAVGLITARAGVNVSGGQLDVGSNIKIGNAGVITATSFSGSGANLTGNVSLTGSELSITNNLPILRFQESDTNTASRIIASGGKLFIQAGASGSGETTSVGNVNITGYNGQEYFAKFIGNGAVELYYNNEKMFATLADGAEFFDSDNNFNLYFNCNGTRRGYIFVDATGGGQISLMDSQDHSMLKATKNGSVELYHDNSRKLFTNSGGVTVESTGNTPKVQFRGASNLDMGKIDVDQFATNYSMMRFFSLANGTVTEWMRLLDNGNFCVGGMVGSSNNNNIQSPGQGNGNTNVGSAMWTTGRFICNSASTFSSFGRNSTGTVISFTRQGGDQGSIGVAVGSVSFNTSSDYRLKENVVSITDGITRVKQLAPKRFNFIEDTTNTLRDGFLAHEVSSIVPESITGTKDEVDSDNNPIYQSIDYSKLVPLLTAALQEETAKREALEARVAALEGS